MTENFQIRQSQVADSRPRVKSALPMHLVLRRLRATCNCRESNADEGALILSYVATLNGMMTSRVHPIEVKRTMSHG